MLYQNYKLKIKKIVDVLKVLRRFRALIISILATILVAGTTLVVTKGLVYGTILKEDKIEYGEKLSYSVKALLSDVSYEFSEADKEEWTETQPYLVGEYKIRAVSRGSFGERYSEAESFTIFPRKVDVKIKESSVTYGNNPTATATLVYGDTISCTDYSFEDLTLSKTRVSAVKEKVVIKDKAGRDVTSSYNINIVKSNISFAKRDITITVDSKDTVYNGQALKCEVFENTPTVYNDVVVAVKGSFSGIIGAGEIDNDAIFEIKSAGGKDVTHQYNIKKVLGKLKIDKKPIIIKNESESFVYDGKEHINRDFTYDEKQFIGNDYPIVVDSPAVIEVGDPVENFLVFEVKDLEDNVKTDNYSFVFESKEYVSVTKRPISITTPSISVTYDAQAHKADSEEDLILSNPSDLAEGHKLVVDKEASASITTVGQVENALDIKIENELGKDVSQNYDWSVTNGSLVVNKRYIKITSDGLYEYYNGKEQTAHGYTVEALDQLIDGHTINPTYTGAITDCGSILKNYFSVTITDKNGEVHSNYEIELVEGEMELIPLPVVIKTNSYVKYYDGIELRLEDFTYVSENVFFEEVRVVGAPAITIVGSVKNEFTVEIYKGEDRKTDNYQITYESYGELVVNKRPVTIGASSASKEYYDAQPIINPGHYVVEDEASLGIAPNQSLTVNVEAENYVDAGTWVNKITSYVIKAGEEDVTEYYEITCTNGSIYIGKRPITIISDALPQGTVYDGEIHTQHTVSVSEEWGLGLVNGHELKVSFLDSSKIQDVVEPGIYNLFNLDDIIIEGTETSVLKNYLPTCTYNYLYLEKRQVVFESNSLKEYYDGIWHTQETYTEKDEGHGLVEGHIPEFTYYGIVKDATYLTPVVNDYVLNVIKDASGKDVTGNYEYRLDTGILEILPRPIVLTSNDASKVYDSYELYNHEITVGGMGYVPNQAGEYISFAEIVNAETKDNTFELDYIYDTLTGEIISKDNYDIDIQCTGKLSISKRPINIVIESKDWMYDGEAHTYYKFNYEFFSQNRGAIDDHEVEVEFTDEATITLVGKIPNAHKDPVITQNRGGKSIDVTDNYEIAVTEGTLEVTKRPITLDVLDDQKVYDAKPLYPTLEIGGYKLVSGETLVPIYSPTINGEIKNVGTQADTVESWVISNDAYGDVTGCYEVLSNSGGTLTITPRPLEIVSNGGYKEYYDGGNVEHNGYTYTGLVDDPEHKLSFTIQYEQIDYGWSLDNWVEDSVVILEGEENVTSNYDISYVQGVVEVANKRPITITSKSDSVVYFGDVYDNQHYEIGGMGLATKRADVLSIFWTADEMKNVGVYQNSFDYMISYNGEDITNKNYDVTKVEGEIEITPLDLYIKTFGDKKIFDGTPLTNEGYEFKQGILPNGEYEKIKTTGTITEVGKVDNTYEIQIFDKNHNKLPLSNYNINEVLGKLEIEKLVIEVTSGSDEKEYDGTPLTCTTWQSDDWYASQAYKRSQVRLVVKTSGSITDIGVTDNPFIAYLEYTTGGKEVNPINYEITKVNGTLTVYAAPLYFESQSGTLIYNGVEQYIELLEKQEGYISPLHEPRVEFTGFGIDVGEYENSFTVDIVDKETGESVKDLLYPNIVTKFGTITIEKLKLTIDTPKLTVEYDGYREYAPNDIGGCSELEALNKNGSGNTYEITIDDMSDFYIDGVGKLTYAIPFDRIHVFVNGTEIDKAKNLDITVNEGYIEVNRNIIYITVYKVTREYDGTMKSYRETNWYYDKSQLPEGFTLDVKLRGGRVDVGQVDLSEIRDDLVANGLIKVYDANGNDVTSSYSFALEGTPLTVTPAELTITANSAEKYYDKKPLKDNGYTVEGLQDGHTLKEGTFEIVGEQTKVGQSYNRIVGVVVVLDENGNDVTSNYNITTVAGELIVLDNRPE